MPTTAELVGAPSLFRAVTESHGPTTAHFRTMMSCGIIGGVIEVEWEGLEAGTRESCRVVETAAGVEVVGSIRGGGWECAYTLTTDPGWNLTSVVVMIAGQQLQLRRDGGRWTVNGVERHDLREATDVDISATPLTNTLPIRRLALAIGESADIVTAYVSVPELTVTADPQRYTRTAEATYLYESRDSDFRRSVTVDDHGLVASYPGLFIRSAG